MNLQDLDALAKGLAPVVTKLIAAETAPLIARLAALEAITPAPGAKGEPGERGADGVDGKDAEPVSDAQIAAAVSAYLAAHPPENGRDGADGVNGEKGDPGRDGRDGADGLAAPVVVGAIKDHTGELVLTLTDGTVLRTGIFDGKDGEVGRDGADGFGLEDFSASLAEDGRTVVLGFERGDLKRSFEIGFPIVLDRGVYKTGEAYARGDGVTWGGSFWIAQRDTDAKPEASDDWRLAVKRGRDGKDGLAGKDGQRGEKGEQGMPGRSF